LEGDKETMTISAFLFYWQPDTALIRGTFTSSYLNDSQYQEMERVSVGQIASRLVVVTNPH